MTSTALLLRKATTVIVSVKKWSHFLFVRSVCHHCNRSLNLVLMMNNYFLLHGIASIKSISDYSLGITKAEQYNGITWRIICFALILQKLPESHWKLVQYQALHSITPVLSTNTTPPKILILFLMFINEHILTMMAKSKKCCCVTSRFITNASEMILYEST